MKSSEPHSYTSLENYGSELNVPFMPGIKRLLIVFLFVNFGNDSYSQLSRYEKHVFSDNIFQLPFRLLRPTRLDPSVKYPLLIFLHGSYEKGGDNEMQLEIGGRFFLRDSIIEKYPAFVLFPQCPLSDSWTYFEADTDYSTGLVKKLQFPLRKNPTTTTAALKKLIDSLISSGGIDQTRIYIGGLSQGGMGVLDLIARYPESFAAGFSICGAGNVNTAKRFAGKVSLWLFHGEKDDIIPTNFSRSFFKKLTRLKSDVRYNEYAGVFHNSWVNAFKEPDLMSWLFSKKKSINLNAIQNN